MSLETLSYSAPEAEPHHFTEAALEIACWKADLLDEKQHNLADSIRYEEIGGEVADLIDTFCHYFNPDNPSEFHGPDSAAERYALLRDMEVAMIGLRSERSKGSEYNALDFMSHYLAREIMGARLEIRKLERLNNMVS